MLEEPSNDDWCRMWFAVLGNIPMDDIMTVRNEQVETLRNMADE